MCSADREDIVGIVAKLGPADAMDGRKVPPLSWATGHDLLELAVGKDMVRTLLQLESFAGAVDLQRRRQVRG